jgi:hypothetical protein
MPRGAIKRAIADERRDSADSRRPQAKPAALAWLEARTCALQRHRARPNRGLT